ncbi:hypothetical protein H5410_022041 [Solanum commersonii]|uniref:Uncharacterized protein n=1 Tax=Solanum commersonii TaxID=4109 RepID=A0A9J5ZG02_SOLCO|nr:hypothetical protein H5410_022041 [Solanum commersonii]
MSDQVESNLPQSYENEPSEHLIGPSIPKDNGEVLLTRTDVPETIIDVPSEEFVTQQLEVETLLAYLYLKVTLLLTRRRMRYINHIQTLAALFYVGISITFRPPAVLGLQSLLPSMRKFYSLL